MPAEAADWAKGQDFIKTPWQGPGTKKTETQAQGACVGLERAGRRLTKFATNPRKSIPVLHDSITVVSHAARK